MPGTTAAGSQDVCVAMGCPMGRWRPHTGQPHGEHLGPQKHCAGKRPHETEGREALFLWPASVPPDRPSISPPAPKTRQTASSRARLLPEPPPAPQPQGISVPKPRSMRNLKASSLYRPGKMSPCLGGKRMDFRELLILVTSQLLSFPKSTPVHSSHSPFGVCHHQLRTVWARQGTLFKNC